MLLATNDTAFFFLVSSQRLVEILNNYVSFVRLEVIL